MTLCIRKLRGHFKHKPRLWEFSDFQTETMETMEAAAPSHTMDLDSAALLQVAGFSKWRIVET